MKHRSHNLTTIFITFLLTYIILLPVVTNFMFLKKIEIKDKQLPQLGNLSLYDYYHNLIRPSTQDYSLYVLNPYDDSFLINFFANRDINEILSFVRNDIKYAFDSITNSSYEYPKYPIETIIEGRGDCEDKSILLCSILSLLGHNTSLVRFESHMMALVNGSLVETTNTVVSYNIENALDIFEVNSHPIFVLDWNGMIYSYQRVIEQYFVSLNVSIYNYGNIQGQTTLTIYDDVKNYDFPFTLEPFTEKNIQINMTILSSNIDCELR